MKIRFLAHEGRRYALRALAGAIVLFAGFFAAALAHAQETPDTRQAPAAQGEALTVGVYASPPFVMHENGKYTGMAVDLWEALAGQLGLRFDYREYDTLRALVDAAAAQEIDVAVTNLTITERRAERIDFTQPWFDAGLRLMVGSEQGASFWGVVQGLRDSGYLRAYAWLALIIVFATIGFTLFDRRFDADFPRRWRDGIAESFYTVMSIATSGKAPARKNLFGWVGRIWQGLWLVCGIAVLAYVTSSVTSVMTTLALTNQISSVADLPGKTVGVAEGSTAEEFAQESLLHAISFKGIDDSVHALVDGRIDAIIGDTPVLEYYSFTHPEMPVEVTGGIFQPDKYGFGLPHRSPLTRDLTVAVVGAREDGLVDELRAKYFGDGQ